MINWYSNNELNKKGIKPHNIVEPIKPNLGQFIEIAV